MENKVILTDLEIECCRLLSERFARGETVWRSASEWHLIGLTQENHIAVLATLQNLGLISNVQSTNAHQFRMFQIESGVAQVSRHAKEQQQEAAKGPDVVAEMTARFRRHPVVGHVVFWAIPVAAILTVLASLLTIIEKTMTLLAR